MTKTICDICGREMATNFPRLKEGEMQFSISSYGRYWDICDDCRTSLNVWIKGRIDIKKSKEEDK